MRLHVCVCACACMCMCLCMCMCAFCACLRLVISLTRYHTGHHEHTDRDFPIIIVIRLAHVTIIHATDAAINQHITRFVRLLTGKAFHTTATSSLLTISAHQETLITWSTAEQPRVYRRSHAVPLHRPCEAVRQCQSQPETSQHTIR